MGFLLFFDKKRPVFGKNRKKMFFFLLLFNRRFQGEMVKNAYFPVKIFRVWAKNGGTVLFFR